MYGIFRLTTFSCIHNSKFYVLQAHFHVQSIKAGPVMIACKIAKLLMLFHGSSQRERTIKSFLSCYYIIIFHFTKHYCTPHSHFEYVGLTPLHFAAAKGSTDVLHVLYNVPGCDINVKVIYANLVLVSLLGVKKVF